MSSSRTLIVGAGLAGLVAADELMRAGQDVLVLEAKARPGGRVLTLRGEFDGGLYAEAGAARIPETHTLTLQLVRRFGLELQPFRAGAPFLFVGGRCLAGDDEGGIAAAFAFGDEDSRAGASAIRARLLARARESLGDPGGPGGPPEAMCALDALSGADLMRQMGLSDGAIAWLDMGGGGIGNESSALNILREMALTSMLSPLRIAGGNDRLPHALAASIGERVCYGAVARRIEQADGGVRVTVEEHGLRREIRGARVVCTLPFTVLRHLEVVPAFSAGKTRAIRELHYNAVTRVFLQTRSRPWLASGRGGFAVTDRGMDIFDASFGLPGSRGLLTAYLRDRSARAVAAMPHDGRVRWAAAELDRIFPGLERELELERTASWSWDDDPYARGAVADFSPGQMSAFLPHIARPEGRVHFAGEHTSPYAGWMQGAIESGMRVATEVRREELSSHA